MNKKEYLLFSVVAIIIIASVIFGVMTRENLPNKISLSNNSAPEIEIIAENLDTPWAIDFLPDDTLIFTQRNGIVSIIEKGATVEIARINSSERGEGGLLGIAVDPQFEENSYIYVYYTTEASNRVSRFAFDKGARKLGSEEIIIDGINSESIHNGGRLKFSPDGYLFITAGDAANPSTAQDTSALTGKILRINKDGTIPNENPFGNAVYSYGHRNPQGLAWNFNGELFASEHGPLGHDEINKIMIGENYGWPKQCNSQDKKTIEPLRCYDEFTLAPSGIALNNNELYIAGLRGTHVRRIVFNKDFGSIVSEEEFITGIGRVREAVIHEGYLYIATSNRDGRGIPQEGDDKIIRINVS